MATFNSTVKNSKNSKSAKGLKYNRPHSLQSEEALLGAMLTTPDAAAAGIEIIKSSDYFFKPSHQIIFNAMRKLYERGSNLDWLTVFQYIEGIQDADDDRAIPKIDKAELLQMRSESPAPSHAEDYAKIVRDHHIRRSLQSAAEEVLDLIQESHELDVDDLVDEAEKVIYSATQERLTKSTNRFDALYIEYEKHLGELSKRDESITGFATGFTDLDLMLSGMQRQNLLIIGARPANGKTSFALQIACNVAKVKPVLFFSMEMSSLEITRRIVAQQSRVQNDKLQTGKLSVQEWQTIGSRMAEFSESQLYIDDNPALSVLEVRAKARRLKSEMGDLGAVVVDYMQLMTSLGRAENRQVEVSDISRSLKILARELDCPVVVLSQLSRGVENRADKKPVLADLRESGSIEQDADVVMFLHREEAYNRETSNQNIVDVSVAKHRSGPTGYIKLHWAPSYTSFGNLAKNAPPTSPPVGGYEDEQMI